MRYLILLLLISCGTRKVENTQKKTYSNTEISTRGINSIRIDSSYTFDFRSLILTPIDENKPMIVDGKELKNVKIESSHKTEEGQIIKIDSSRTREKQKIEAGAEEKTKISEKKNNDLQIPLIILAVGIVIILYLKLR